MSELTIGAPTLHTEQPPVRSRKSRLLRAGVWASGLALAGGTLTACNGDPSTSGSASNTVTSTSSLGVSTGTNAAPKPGPAVLVPGSSHEEIQQFGGVHTFTDYEHAYGYGPELVLGQVVTVDCVATGPIDAAPTVHGKWYHLTGSKADPSVAGYYAAANTFENGSTTGPLEDQPAVDPAVPQCPPN